MLIDSPEKMRELGHSLAGQVKAGDVLLLIGDLGAGKTALTQGIGAALGIDDVTSPTFIISRFHKAKLPLIHIDTYRLLDSGLKNLEFDDLDITTAMKDAITVIEWGEGLVGRLSQEYLIIRIAFGIGEMEREISLEGIGPRWADFKL